MSSTSPNSILTRLLVSGAFLAGAAAAARNADLDGGENSRVAAAMLIGDDRCSLAAEMMWTVKQPVTK